MKNCTETELIIKASSGDPRAFAALADRHYMTVYKYAFRWSEAKEDAEDITQEVFLKLAGKIQLFKNRSRFTTWLYRITANCAKDHARKNNRWKKNISADSVDNQPIASSNPDPEHNVIARNTLTLINTLPDKEKEAVLLVYAEGMNHKEAAKITGCAETTISWRIFQAKRQLKKALS